MSEAFDWARLDKLDAAIAWRREPDHEPLANVWHLETIVELASELRRSLTARELDERLIALLWANVPGDNRADVIAVLRAVPPSIPGGDERLEAIVELQRRTL